MDIHGEHFYFVRHAETLWNTLQLCQGLQDIELSNKGIYASFEFAKKMSKFPIKSIFSSPLKRASKTAEMIYEFHPQSHFELIDELKERSWGSLEGISSEEMYKIEEKEESDPTYICGYGVEDRFAFKNRIIKGLNYAFSSHASPLIVSHGRLFLSLCEILELPLLRQIPNLTLLELKKNTSKWSCTVVNIEDL